MLKFINKDSCRTLPLTMVLSYDDLTNSNTIKAIRNTKAALGKITKSGELKILKSNIGKVCRSNDKIITIKFNFTFAYDDKLYIILPNTIFNTREVVVAYKEI